MVPSESTIAENTTYSEGLGSGFWFQGLGLEILGGGGLYILHPTPYTLHPTPYTLHLDESDGGGNSPRPLYTLHPTPYTSSERVLY